MDPESPTDKAPGAALDGGPSLGVSWKKHTPQWRVNGQESVGPKTRAHVGQGTITSLSWVFFNNNPRETYCIDHWPFSCGVNEVTPFFGMDSMPLPCDSMLLIGKVDLQIQGPFRF